MWIFGYGSLVWKADFPYVKKIIGYIKGYERKFWQASIDHRGVPGRPGRVVTLVPSSDPEARVWGACYEIDDLSPEAAKHLNDLDIREKRFDKVTMDFFPILDVTHEGISGHSLCVTTVDMEREFSLDDTIKCTGYISRMDGPLFLGDAPVDVIATEASIAVGPSGTLQQAKVWGAAYKIHPRDVDHVVKHLDLREVMGYEKTPVQFYPLPHHQLNLFDVETSSSASLLADSNSSRPSSADSSGRVTQSNYLSHGTAEHESFDAPDKPVKNGQNSDQKKNHMNQDASEDEEQINHILEGNVPGGHFVVIMYYGNSENEHFIGPAPIEEMVQQIHESSGPSGSNKEYLFNLADAMRQICEEAIDQHLGELEMRVRKLEMSLNKKKSGHSTPIEL